ncbi:MAG: hypothetical protein H0W50_00265 [Parachlamydiaceae bacterium]|nr:hypothetical protein [Parachlamydiaceae bacterium]
MANYFFNKTRNIFFCSLTVINTILSVNSLQANSASQQDVAPPLKENTTINLDYYGFVSKLPNDVEAFSADFQTHDLWVKLANSNWAAELLSLEFVKSEPKIQLFTQLWNSTEGKRLREIMELGFGVEFEIVLPAGFSKKLMPLANLYNDLLLSGLSSSIFESINSKDIKPLNEFYNKNAPEIFSSLAISALPPMIFVSKPTKSKKDIYNALDKLVMVLKLLLPSTFEQGSFKTSDKSEFQFLLTKAERILPEGYLKEVLKDQANSDEIIAAINAKQFELAWGWIDDHFVISIGSDHTHVRFSANNAESALNIPEVKKIAAQYAEKKPFNLSYSSQSLSEKFGNNEIPARILNQLGEALTEVLTSNQLIEVKALAKNLKTISDKHFVKHYDPVAVVGFFDNGLHYEQIGGRRATMLDFSQPLALSSLADSSAFISLDYRMSSQHVEKIRNYIEESATSSLEWYTKSGRNMLPQPIQAGAAMGEMVVFPMLKQIWNSDVKLGESLGLERALIIDFNGTLPVIANHNGKVPRVAFIKVPRVAFISELKDREGVSKAWNTFPNMQPILTLAFGMPNVFLLKTSIDKTVELYSISNFEMGDFMPHFAISQNLWITNTSPLFSKALVSKSTTETKNSLGAFLKINFTSLWNFGDDWFNIAKKDPDNLFRPRLASEFQRNIQYVAAALKLSKSIISCDIQINEENGQTRNSYYIDLKDLPAANAFSVQNKIAQ